jgi:hypothetical protein
MAAITPSMARRLARFIPRGTVVSTFNSSISSRHG